MSSKTAGSIGRRGPACAALYSLVMAPSLRSSANTCSDLRARASHADSSLVCTWLGSPFLFTGVYNTSRNALVPTCSAASDASLALLAALSAPRLLDEDAPAIMTAARTRLSPPPDAAMQSPVESGSVMHEKMRMSLGYASGKLPMKRR